MKKAEIINTVVRNFNKGKFQMVKHSPEILVVSGIIGAVAGAVVACKATTKLGDILDDTREQLDVIRAFSADEERCEKHDYTQEDSKKDITIVYAKSGVKIAKLYAPAVIIGGLSIAGILASNNILRKRNVALAAAYATIDKGFKEYRNRVVDRFGKEVDHELRYNIKAKKFEETVVDEKGKEKKVTNTVKVSEGLNEGSDYARLFSKETTLAWNENHDYNMMFLKCQQKYANDRLVATGHLFLNDVYKELGLATTKAGQIVGWTYDDKNPTGDNFVDFGLFQENFEKVGSYTKSILLDFNVDGPILNTMTD
ncbi:DUF6353 family protein [Bacteroides sp.]|uniref:DUF6353 family protein n=1 Tax=Bacteroides sp. TaxID=29523 RepID=UPI0026076036|nr:DUF6353 family protein [Bacteroides sp.]